MLAVTDTAKRHLHDFLTSSDKPEVKNRCFRVVQTAHELFLTLRLAKPAPGDKTYRYDGKTVLALPKSLQRVCRERRLHVDDDGKLFLS
jgi:Fe-S cluster assembly iron-binding protein IscA